ncbi:MAG TPA: hypothetical protein VGZ00_05310 [Candidatus Baltobacteraceae bacterium]|jgi:hypothetical protein|nr:hypothetical protein [Candidatus Baltobacteraceae bacterium]
MNETAEGHPWRRPDPERVSKWRADIEHIREAVITLVKHRDDFEALAKIVRGNKRILYGESHYPASVKSWYTHSQVMAIRRLVDQGGDGGNVRSLRLLLEDMRRAAEAFTRGNIEELFDAPEAPEYEQEMREFLVSAMWKNAGDTESNTDRLYTHHIKSDLKALAESSARIKKYADKIIAHDTVEVLNEDERPKFSDISACVDVIEGITMRYVSTLTGYGYSSLSPVPQYDTHDIFRFAWKPLPDERYHINDG